MEYPEVSDSPLTWSWIIEALATSREVELDLLCDLVDASPKLCDNLCKAAREMIALRNLEDLYDPAKVLNNGVSSEGEGIQFDSSESFSSVLQRVMSQPSVSSLRKHGSNPLPSVRKVPDKLMREIHALFERRKTSMPRCTLQELSNMLQKGDACDEAILKRQRNCLQNGSVEIAELPPEKKLRHDNNCPVAYRGQKLAPLNVSQLHECSEDDQSEKLFRHDCNGSTASAEKKLASPLISFDTQKVPVDDHNSDPLISSDKNQSHPSSWMPDQSVYKCDLSSEGDKVKAKKSSTSADTTELELDICIKCNEGGEVLICSLSSCPTVVHERCLGFSLSIDNRDDFICPFCVCSSAKSEYAEAKDRMLLAREKVSLFVAGKPDHLSKGFTSVNSKPPSQGVDVRMLKEKGVLHVDRTSTGKQHEGRGAQSKVQASPPNCFSKKGEVDIGATSSMLAKRFMAVNTSPQRQGRDERPLKGKGVYQVNGASTDEQHKGHVAGDNVHTLPSNCSSKKEVEDVTVKNCQLEEEYTDVNANPPRQSTDERPSKGKGVYQAKQASVDQQQKGHLVGDNVHTSPPKSPLKEGEHKTVKNCQFEKGKQPVPIEHFSYAGAYGGFHELRPRQRSHYAGDLKGTSETENHTANPSNNKLSPQSQQKRPERMQGTSSTHRDDSDGISLEKTFRDTPSKSSERVKSPHFARNLDRLRVPWTAEEVEMLKEGMKRFGSNNMVVIPWTTILEFGSNVFWKGRTGVNLKDKWRNLVKANPNLR